MNDIKLNYPIKLYIKKSSLFFYIFFPFLFICTFSYNFYDIALKESYLFFLVFGFIAILMCVFFIFVFSAVFLINQPTITITPSNIEFFNLFKENKRFFWSQVENIELDFYMHKSVKHWQLIILSKQGYGEKIVRPLQKMTYQDMELNEKEIFSIIEQSFKGEQPTYKSIEMGLESQVAFNKYFWGFMLAIIPLIFIFVFGGFSLFDK